MPKAGSSAFVQKTTASNVSSDASFIDSAEANSQPTAEIQVTQDWNPNGKDGTYNANNVGVYYNTSKKEWPIFNEDGS